jgi:hypothetical protein
LAAENALPNADKKSTDEKIHAAEDDDHVDFFCFVSEREAR